MSKAQAALAVSETLRIEGMDANSGLVRKLSERDETIAAFRARLEAANETIVETEIRVWREAARRCQDVPKTHLPDYFDSIADDVRRARAAIAEIEGK